VCIVDYGCFSPDEALDLYFSHGEEEHDLIDWDHEFNWDDWRSNFDMTYERWYEDYDWSVLFPIEFEEDGVYYSCDEEYSCWTFNEETQESCTYEGECFTVEAGLEYYFEGDWVVDLSDWENIEDGEWTEWTEDWMDEFDTTDPEWYLEIPEDFDFSLIFKYESYDEFGTMWACDEEVDMSDPNDCEPCTDYAMWVEPGDGQFKQDNDGKCWSTNEQGSSNGLRLCNEVLTEQLEGEMCRPCTDYAMWVEPGDGQYK
jgi:hypothetical protein